jgi:hypothetical protein
VSGGPLWKLIAEVFFSNEIYIYAQSEWARRQGHLSRIDNQIRLKRLLRFYEDYESVILDVLSTRTPILASPHRQKFERLRSLQGDELVFDLAKLDIETNRIFTG